VCQYEGVEGDPVIDERENMAYGARPYLEKPPPPAPRDLMTQVDLNPGQPVTDEVPEDLR